MKNVFVDLFIFSLLSIASLLIALIDPSNVLYTFCGVIVFCMTLYVTASDIVFEVKQISK